MKPDYKSIYKIVKNKFDRTNHFYHGPFDETFFSMRVFEMSKILIKEIDCNKEVILTAALLHDIGKTNIDVDSGFEAEKYTEVFKKEWRKHANLGVAIATRILKDMGHDETFISDVCYLIENHDKRNMKDVSVDLAILQDADLLADIGIVGFIRVFLYAAKFKKSVIESVKYGNKCINQNFNIKELNLSISKEIAKKRLKHQSDLFKEMKIEIDSEVIDSI